VNPVCYAVSREWFEEIGGFDSNLRSGEFIDLSFKSWQNGGPVSILDDSRASSVSAYIGVADPDAARLAESWFSSHVNHFYNSRSIDPTKVELSRDIPSNNFDFFIEKLQPELGRLYDLRTSFGSSSLAIVGPGPSAGMVRSSWLARHDLVIGVDYMGLVSDCDFVITEDAGILSVLREKYSDDKFILPLSMFSRATGRKEYSPDLASGSVFFETDEKYSLRTDCEPPFAYFGNIGISAAHLGLFFGACDITLYGFDNKVVGGKSHLGGLPDYYDDGCIWPDTEPTRREFAKYEYGLDVVGKIACSNNIPMLRVGHA
jgi:hypothetical protein